MLEKQSKERCQKKIEWGNLNKIDYFALSLCALCTLILFCQTDIIITGNNGMLFLESPFQFYSHSHKFWGEYSANYLPSTFILFAIWNIPIRLLGARAHLVEDTPLWQIYWYKLLPCIIFLLCAWLVYLLCRQLKFEETKSRFVTYAFMTAPLAFFSQFIFCQYDIFTVFFILLALRFYFNGQNGWRETVLFCLCFGVSFTFKYHAILFFLVLLFLKVKGIPQIIGGCMLSGLPVMTEILLCMVFDGDSFQKAVMGFSALEYATDASGIQISFSSVNLMALCVCLLIAWSYFSYPKTERDFVCDSFFFCSGICVTLFGLMAWHPQWLLLGVVFWTVSASLSQHYDTFLWLDMLEIVIFYCLTVIKFAGNVDQTMLSYGLFRSGLYRRELDASLTMREVLHITNVDDGMLYSVFLAILIVRFVFSHREQCQEQLNHLSVKVWLLRLRMCCGILLFVIPACMCLPDMLSQKTILQDEHNNLSVAYIQDLEHRGVVQNIILESAYISKIQLFTGTFGERLYDTSIQLQIREAETGEVIGESLVCNEQIGENMYTDFLFDDVEVKENLKYQFIVNVISTGVGENVTIYYYNEADWVKEENSGVFLLEIGEEELKSSMVMRVIGIPETRQ